MRTLLLAAAAAFALTACGQSSAPAEEEAPAAPQTLLDEVQAMEAANQMVWAVTQLQTQQQANPALTPTCANVRATESRGVIPADTSPESLYAAHIGSLVFSVQCGNLVSRERFDPNEHWLVVVAPGATEVAIVNCANARGTSDCPRDIPRVAAAPAPATP
jgi:hypothetical protein